MNLKKYYWLLEANLKKCPFGALIIHFFLFELGLLSTFIGFPHFPFWFFPPQLFSCPPFFEVLGIFVNTFPSLKRGMTRLG